MFDLCPQPRTPTYGALGSLKPVNVAVGSTGSQLPPTQIQFSSQLLLSAHSGVGTEHVPSSLHATKRSQQPDSLQSPPLSSPVGTQVPSSVGAGGEEGGREGRSRSRTIQDNDHLNVSGKVSREESNAEVALESNGQMGEDNSRLQSVAKCRVPPTYQVQQQKYQ